MKCGIAVTAGAAQLAGKPANQRSDMEIRPYKPPRPSSRRGIWFVETEIIPLLDEGWGGFKVKQLYESMHLSNIAKYKSRD
ncbi:MAG: hypothetical protein LBC86_08225 [Oscillospiraceae bacterium]|jgi:hypothetical protein|nr:hypothetical protein [Oscillospiraceae bacterium]